MADRSSRAHQLFDSIVDSHDVVEKLRSFIHSHPPRSEDEIFDCKLTFEGHTGKPLYPKAVSSIWSEALSGFANSAGGVLVFGLDARRNSTTEIDEVIAEKLVDDPEGFKSRLTELLRDATDPPILGVEVRAFVADSMKNTGFVVCLIPESTHVPHKTMMCPGKPFFYRQADNFREMDLRMLRRMFYPQFTPDLEFTVISNTSYRPRPHPPQVTIELTLEVQNVGMGTAKDVLILIGKKPIPETLRPELRNADNAVGNLGEWDQSTIGKAQDKLAFHAKRPMHPQACSRIVKLIWHQQAVPRNGKYVTIFDSIELSFTGYAENMPPNRSDIIIPFEALISEEPVTIKIIEQE